MKANIFTLFFITMMLFACKKENTITPIAEDKGCIERKNVLTSDHSGYSINALNIPIINGLFTSNHIDNSKYRYHYYFEDSVQTYFPPYAKFDSKTVRVNEFTNGLEIFTGEILFSFKNNVISFQNGNSTKGTSLNTSPNLTIGQLRTLFLGNIEQFDQRGNQYKDSCFTAQFGYYNLNVGASTAPEHLIKSWKVTLKGRIYPSEYPIAYYQDDDGKLIYYSNGIETFR